jgi:uncharacterized protein YjgD (DUF1641 family)
VAKAIRLIEKKTLTDEEVQVEALGAIVKALSDNRQAVLQFLDILGEMHKSGVLDIAQGVMKNREKLGEVGFEFIKVANIPVMLKNVIMAVQFMGRQDPMKMQILIDSLGKGVDQAMQQDNETKSMFGLFGMMRDPEVRASLSMGLQFMKGMGTGLKDEKAGAP